VRKRKQKEYNKGVIMENIKQVRVNRVDNIECVFIEIPGSNFPNYGYADPTLVLTDTTLVEFMHLEVLKKILGLDGVEMINVTNNVIGIVRGHFALWKDILPCIDKILKEEVSPQLSLDISEMLPEENLIMPTKSFTVKNEISFCFRKRASRGVCFADRKTKTMDLATKFGEAIVEKISVFPWVERITLLPYTINIKTEKGLSAAEMQDRQIELEQIIMITQLRLNE
jgi:hypothetical protein